MTTMIKTNDELNSLSDKEFLERHIASVEVINLMTDLALLDYEVKVARYTLRDLLRDIPEHLVEQLENARDFLVDTEQETIIPSMIEDCVKKHNEKIEEAMIADFEQREQKKADDKIASLTETEIANIFCGHDTIESHLIIELSCSLEVFAMICEDSNLIKFLKYKKADTVTYRLIDEYELLQDDPTYKDDIISEIDSLVQEYRDAVKEADFEHAEYIQEKLRSIYNNM